MIHDAIHDLVQGFIHAIAYVVFTAFLGWLYAPDEVLCLL